MINRIMTLRAAALALAAPLLIATPALADKGQAKYASPKEKITVRVQNGGITIRAGQNRRAHQPVSYRNYGDRGHRGYAYLNEFGQTEQQERRLRRRAIRACRIAVNQEANYIGFRDVDFESRARARQIGPKGFKVTFRAVEFEGRRRDFERPVSCVVRGGDNVKQVIGVPEPRRRGQVRRQHSEVGYRY